MLFQTMLKRTLVLACRTSYYCSTSHIKKYKKSIQFLELTIKLQTRNMSSRDVKPNSASSPQDEPVVSVVQGKLRGASGKLHDGSVFYSFKGIPYAQEPAGELRFRPPQPPLPWSGVRDATSHGGVCPQLDIITMQTKDGTDDHLFLNVYTRSVQPGVKKPVMFFIHGGGFMSGSGDSETYGPEYLLQHDVVLVTINYRLELLGFLTLDTPEVPGNAGLKDQVAALKWVKENISQFGGDPDNVTIFGESAGSACVSYHLLSPMSKGLFHKAIAQSGACPAYWTIGHKLKERAFKIGKILGCDTNDTKELLKFFREQPANKLSNVSFVARDKIEKYKGLTIFFAPVVEKSFPGVEAFLDRDPIELLLENKVNDVPTIMGYNSAEGIMVTPGLIKFKDVINKNFHYCVPRDLILKTSDNVAKDFGARIKEFYFQGKDYTPNDLQKIADFASDFNFVYAVHRYLYFYKKATKSPVFMYRFNYNTEMNFLKKVFALDVEGANHFDEIFYLFRTMMTTDVYEQDKNVRHKVHEMTKLWTDFAKTGNPTPTSGVKWEPYSCQEKEFLRIDNDGLSVDKYADKERAEFWNKLYLDAGLPGFSRSRL